MENINKDDGTPTGTLKDKSLKAAGYAYLVGDAALAASGLINGQHREAATGLVWGLGGLAAARYGNPDAETQLKLLSKRLRSYLDKQSITIPANPDTKTLVQEGGVIDHIESFLYTYPSQMLNAVYGAMATQMTVSGLAGGHEGRNYWTAGSGALITAGALAGLLIPEKKPDPNHKPEGTIDKTISWFREKPLRISSVFYTLNNGALVMSALTDKKQGKNGYWFKFLTVASYVFGNAMLGATSKDHGNNSEDSSLAMSKLATSAASVIIAQPPQMQEALINQISAFLSTQPNVTLKAEEISTLLHSKLKEISAKQASVGTWQQRLQSQPSAPVEITF